MTKHGKSDIINLVAERYSENKIQMESWLSGRRRTTGNRVTVMSGSRVQIPDSPPYCHRSSDRITVVFLFPCIAYTAGVWYRLYYQLGLVEVNKMDSEVGFRYAERTDVALILRFIKELADYEKMLNEVVADEKTLEEWIFDKQKAEVIFALEESKEVGFALFFHNFSTFLGKSGIYLEDLYVRPEYRGKGYGKAILKKLASIAVERGYGRLEWWCLDWNKPSIDFYLSLGAEPMSDWTVYRIAGDTLLNLAE